MNFVFITSGSFPYGESRTNRLITLAKGIVEFGHDVQVLLIYPSNQQSINSNKIFGNFNSISFKYTSLTTKWPKNILLKFKVMLKGVFYGLIEITKLNKTKNIDALIILEYYPLRIALFLIFARLNKIKVLHGYNEYPFINQNNTFLKRIRLRIYLRYILKKYDGVFLITKALKDYYSPFLNKNSQSIEIPMTVEPDRFLNYNKVSDFDFPYIAYCGSMYTDKDGLLILIEAFGLITKQFPDVHLVLIGNNSNKEKFKYIENRINELSLSDKIHLTGKVERDKMPVLLCNAKLLALSRPDNIQAKGGFPTKLGEYLATGLPIVVTQVGEIPLFLKDGENAFVSKPNDPVAFSKKIYEVLNDYSRARKIGKNGQQLALGIFNYKVQARNLIDFINKIKNPWLI